MDQGMAEMAHKTFDLEAVKFLELQDKICNQMGQTKIEEKKHWGIMAFVGLSFKEDR